MWRSSVVVLLLLLACASNPKTVAVEPPAVVEAPVAAAPVTAEADFELPLEPLGGQQTLADNTAMSTQAGTNFTAPATWTVRTSPALVILEAPERDLHVYVLDVDATNADEALTRAWARVDPSMKRAVNAGYQVPGRRGWDEQFAVVYMTSPNEHMIVFALVLRHGNAWSALLIDGALGTYEKRMSQVGVISSLTPAGYTRENFKGRTAVTLGPAEIARIVDMVEEGRKAAGVPGVGLALIQNGTVVYSGGLGVRDLTSNAPVTDRTRFMVGSNTKALTTLMLAKLVDEGRFNWNTPVTAINPAFALGDPEVTKQVLVKHLVCACTGMPRQDFEWLFEFAKSTPASVMATLATMRPTSGFGEVFQYSNAMAAAAGYSASAAVFGKRELGRGYDELMRTRVFVPLGMRDTTFDFAKALASEHATPYGADIDGNVSSIDLSINRALVSDRPAGGAWSTVRDMTRYVQFELATGVLPNGKRSVSEASILARREKQIAMGEDLVYGMGLMVDSRYGVDVVHHGGSVSGYQSDMFWIPEARVGGVILTNHDAGAFLLAPLIRRTLEVLYDGHDEARENMLTTIARNNDWITRARAHLTVPPENPGLAEHYVNDALGNLDVRKSGTDVIFDFGEWHSRVASRHNDDGTTSLITIDPGIAGFEFVMDASGLILRDGQHAYVFSPR